MESLKTLTKEMTKEQFKSVVMTFKGRLELEGTNSLVFSVKMTELGYDFQVDEVVKGAYSGYIEHNILLHSRLTEQDIIEHSYEVFKKMAVYVRN